MGELSCVVSREKVLELQKAMSVLPQHPGFETKHIFCGGMYCRWMIIPAGSIIVGKEHKTDHFFIGCVGELEVYGQGESYILAPGNVIPSLAGTKRVVRARTDFIGMVIHRTDQTEANESLERELMEFDEFALYDVDNHPKDGVLIYEEQNCLPRGL